MYQVFWMLLILFAAPEVFDRYRIRNECEVFNHEHLLFPENEAFCSSGAVTGRMPASGVDPTVICETLSFPVADGETCPDFGDGPTLDRVMASGLCGAGCDAQTLLDDADSVRCPSACAPVAVLCTRWHFHRPKSRSV